MVMKYFLHYKDGKIIGSSNCPNISNDFECVEVSKQEYDKYFEFLELKKEKERLIDNLVGWFDGYFDKQIIQSQWQNDFSVSHDDYFNKDYSNIDDLIKQAQFVREEIKRLRAEVQNAV